MSMENLKISNELIDELKNADNLQKMKLVNIHLNKYLERGYDPTDMNYHLFNELIQAEGISKNTVYSFLLNLVKKPQFVFKEDEGHFPKITLMVYLVGASYWLDKDLFNEKCLFKKIKPNMPISEKNLINLLDIGCVLLSKGFKLPDPNMIRNPELVNYIKTYENMVKKRFNKFYRSKNSSKQLLQTEY